jgi:SAM-dependent methyltransferase
VLYDIGASERDKRRYWNEFYASRQVKKLAAPSQFAAFVVQEAVDAGLIIEVGCGTGRDSLFFARQGFKVVAIDGSEAAIAHCNTLKAETGIDGASFHAVSVGSPDFSIALGDALPIDRDFATVAYARFFLHAISDAHEDALLSDLAAVLKAGDMLALEYRTVRDASGTKVTEAHYRRFVEPSRLFGKAAALGFSVFYAVEGFGFAKYREDDAYVARCVLKKD